MFFFKNQAENEEGRLAPDLILFIKKASFELKASSMQLSFKIFQKPSIWHASKTNYKASQYWSRDMLNLDF